MENIFKAKMKLSICILLCGACLVEPLRILSVLPTSSKSHYAATSRIITELANKGHEVVSISPFGETNPPKNLTWIEIEVKSFEDAIPEIKKELQNELSFFEERRWVWKTTSRYIKYIVELPKLKNFIENDNSHFDLVLAEEFFQPLFFVFAHKYKAPLILISTFGSGHFISEYMGNPLELSYVPNEFLELFGNMNLCQRAWNLICTIYDIIGRHMHVHSQNELAKEVFHNIKDIPHLSDLERNSSLILLNSHFSLTVVRPFLPNIVEIGGVHMKDVQPLSQELKTILDSAKEGAVLFSFGSILELPLMPDDFVLKILNTLGKLKQTVLLKWNSDENFPVTHKNLYPFKWLPQNDILSHPNIVLFITHGGLLGSQETIYHGVPIICIPFYGDQPLNCERSFQMGYGLPVQKSELMSSDSFEKAIDSILTNPTYRNNTQELSRRFRDRPNSAIDTAIYWIEYCARHKGMKHATGPKRNLYWFQYYFLDLFLVLLATLWCLQKLLKFLLCRPETLEKLKIN